MQKQSLAAQRQAGSWAGSWAELVNGSSGGMALSASEQVLVAAQRSG